ncbi:Polyketide cyclase / dehydrase and lipid transport [Pedobacter westerhofensis]|uniref:Polyketide cyclase / dehydrase and lipid transport n=2 Tax=Pedobacter westerhofensis TaxID=425512 RepID=A0A521E5Y5_9SPHI|nr:Polyketide cyclase / dehydrase and lipid transport [Pedobacter westerhofensis]
MVNLHNQLSKPNQMNIIVKILIVLLVIIAIPLILALFIKKEYHVERQITINRPRKAVFDYIRFLNNQEHYSKWVMMDPNMKKTLTGTDGTVGFTYAWDGNKAAGKGEQEIININEGEGIDVQVRFIRPFEGIAYTPITTYFISPSQTPLKWEMKGTSPYPLNFTNLFVDNMLGKDLESSLSTLKGILEKQ